MVRKTRQKRISCIGRSANLDLDCRPAVCRIAPAAVV